MRDDRIDEHKHEPSPPAPTSAVVQEKSQAHTARTLRNRLKTVVAPFTVFLLCYGLATTCTLMGELPINVVGGVEKDNHLRRDFEYMNPRALRSGGRAESRTD